MKPLSWTLIPGLLLLASCAEPPRVELQNRQPAQQLERQRAAPPGSLYSGWRVYQQRCASCHGAQADGSGGGADLLLRVRDLGARRFVDLVLRRYGSDLQPGQGSPRETLVDEVLERRAGSLQMPAWQGDAVVEAHVMDLYAYLSARAEGQLGVGRP